MKKNVIKLTESQLDELVKMIMNEEKGKLNKKPSKSLNEGKEFILKFQKEKRRLVKEGYSKEEINEQMSDFLGFGKSAGFDDSDKENSMMGDIGYGSVKQWMISWILDQLNVSGELNKVLSIALSKANPKDYAKLFDPVDNCEFVADLTFDTFLQYMLEKLISTLGGKVSGGKSGGLGGFASSDLLSMVAGNAIMSLTKNVEFKKTLQKTFQKALCQALRGEGGEAELSSELEDSEIPDVVAKDIKSRL